MRILLESTCTPHALVAHAARAIIFRQGDPAGSVMQIERGQVRLAVLAPDGKEAICGLLGAGAFLGEEALAGDDTRRQTACALTDTEVVVVSKAHMARLLRTEPSLAERFTAHILARHARLEEDLATQLLYQTERRVAHALLELAGCDDRRACNCDVPPVSQEIVAEMAGTSRSRVNVCLGKFKRLGFIELDHGRLRVHPQRLPAVSDERQRIA